VYNWNKRLAGATDLQAWGRSLKTGGKGISTNQTDRIDQKKGGPAEKKSQIALSARSTKSTYFGGKGGSRIEKERINDGAGPFRERRQMTLTAGRLHPNAELFAEG